MKHRAMLSCPQRQFRTTLFYAFMLLNNLCRKGIIGTKADRVRCLYPFPKTLFNCVTFQSKLLPVRIILSLLFLCEKFRSKHRKEVPFPKKKSLFSVCDIKRDFCLLGISQTLAQTDICLFYIQNKVATSK